MRALLVVNPAATTTTARGRDVLISALGHDLKLEVGTTERRGHAAEMARGAVADGIDLVIALGGDGTVNEVVNGLLGAGPEPGLPGLGVVPGGSTNVFARAVGVPRDPIEATGAILEAVREGRSRAVGLGRADERWFTFCAGLGLDAEVIAAVESHRAQGRRSTGSLYVGTAVRQFFATTDRALPALTLERPGVPPLEGLYLGIVANAAPWTYIGNHPVNPTPRASFDTGLDLFGLRGLGTASTLRHVRQILLGARPPRGRNAVTLHDQSQFTLSGQRPIAFQVDGEYLGVRERVRFVSVPAALRVFF